MSIPNHLPAAPKTEALPHRRWALIFLLLATVMNLLDVTIVNVGLPAMQADLGATSTQIEWVSAIYVLAFALGLLPFGRLGDILGRREIFLGGVATFTVASMLCGIAPSIELLVAARLLQGIAGAAMVPQVLALIAVIFPPEEKPMAFSLFGVIGSLSSVAGPLIGGALISADIAGFGWRTIFLINLPLGVITILGSMRFVPRLPSNALAKLDWVGIALFGAATLLMVFPLIEGRAYGWPWWMGAMLCAAPLLAAAFYSWERRQSRRHGPELLPMTLLVNRGFLGGLVTVTLFFSGIPGLFLVLAIVLQSGFDMSAMQSGMATMPFPLGVMVASLASGRLGSGFLRARVAMGSLLLAIGMTYLHFVLLPLAPPIHWLSLASPLLLCGLGMGVAISALFQSLMNGVAANQSGAASGALQAFQHVGGAIGIAVTGQMFFSHLNTASMAEAFAQAAANSLWYQITIFSLIALFNIVILFRPARATNEKTAS